MNKTENNSKKKKRSTISVEENPASLEVTKEADQDNNLAEFRAHLIAADQKAHDDYDKNVLALSGGALGISFAFVKDFISTKTIIDPNLLILAWILWAFSIVCVLISFLTSIYAIRYTIKQVDNGDIYSKHTGGGFSPVTAVVNILSGISFISGVIIIACFVQRNL